jgi:hypothetical protein
MLGHELETSAALAFDAVIALLLANRLSFKSGPGRHGNWQQRVMRSQSLPS